MCQLHDNGIEPGGVTLADLENDHFMLGKPLDVITVALANQRDSLLEHPDREIWSKVRRLRFC